MIVLVTGGSGCGKSTWAEKLIASLPNENRVYIATMQVYDEESVKRVERHRAQRADKGFRTIECEKDLASADIEDDSILVDQYYTMYFARCYLYKNAMHHFDEENIIEHLLRDTIMISEGRQFKNYDFCTSHASPLTQISDTFVGLISRVFEYLDQVEEADIMLMDRTEYHDVIENMSILWNLIERSDAKHPMLIQNVNDIQTVQQRVRKMQLFCFMNDNH